MSGTLILILVALAANLYAVGVFTGHSQRVLRWLEQLQSPERRAWNDAYRRMLGMGDPYEHLQVGAVVIFIATLVGGFLLYVGSFG